MLITYIGHSSFKLKGKDVTLLIDPYDPKIGKHFPKQNDVDLVLCTHKHSDHHYLDNISSEYYLIDNPGEYDVKTVSIWGISSFHDKKEGAERGLNTIYVIEMEGITFCHLGDLGDVLTDTQLETMGSVDVLFIPVGGKYTIDASEAAKVIAQIEPHIVVPMHYGNKELELVDVSIFLKEMGVEEAPVKSLKVTADDFTGKEDDMSVVTFES